LLACDASLVAEFDQRVGELGALLWGVDLFGHGREGVPSPVGVVFDRFA